MSIENWRSEIDAIDSELGDRKLQPMSQPSVKSRVAFQGERERVHAAPHRGALAFTAHPLSLPIASTQIKSAGLLAGLAADGITTVEEPAQTRDQTERMLQEFGAQLKRNGEALSVQGGVALHSRNLVVHGDISSAAFSSPPLWLSLDRIS